MNERLNPMDGTGFVRTGAFECDTVSCSAAGTFVAIGTTTGNVHIVTSDGSTRVTFEDPIGDLAVGKRVYAIIGDSLMAISPAGTRVWAVELPEAQQITALSASETLVVLTSDGLIRLIDGDTGTEQLTKQQPRSELTADTTLVGTPNRFVLSNWSFVSVFDENGELLTECNLEGTIRSLGVVSETVVASIQNDRVTGIDAQSGEQQWTNEIDAVALASYGAVAIPLQTTDGTFLITDTGETESIPVSGESMVVTEDCEIICTYGGGTVAIFQRNPDTPNVTGTVSDVAVPAGSRSETTLLIENLEDQPRTVTIDITGDGVTVSPDSITVDIDPQSSVERTITIASGGTPPGTSATIRVECMDDLLAEAPVAVEEPDQLAVATTLEGVEDGNAVLVVELSSQTEGTLHDIRIDPGGHVVSELRPGEPQEIRLDAPYRPGATVSIAVNSADESPDLSDEIELPTDPVELRLETTEAQFVDLTVTNRLEVPVTDTLQIRGDPFDGTIERAIHLDANERFVVVVRADRSTPDGLILAELTGADIAVSTSVNVTPAQPTADRADDSLQTNTPDATRQPRRGTERNQTSRDSTPGEEAGNLDQGTRSEFPLDHDSNEMAVDTRSAPTITATRALSTQTPAVGQAFEETVTVTNNGNAPTNRVQIRPESTEPGQWTFGGGDVTLDTIDAGETLALSRKLAVTEPGPVTLPNLEITSAGHVVDEVEPATLTVLDDRVGSIAVLEASSSESILRVVIQNRSTAQITVRRFGVESADTWTVQDGTVAAGDQREWTRTIPGTIDNDPAWAAVEYETANGDRERLGLLATVLDATQSTDPDRSNTTTIDSDVIGITLSKETKATTPYGIIVPVITNEGEESIELSISASGDSVSELMYRGQEMATLAPNESVSHPIDIEPQAGDTAIELLCEIDSEALEFSIAGTVVEEDAWDESQLSDWSVSPAESSAHGGANDAPFKSPELRKINLPRGISTAFSRR